MAKPINCFTKRTELGVFKLIILVVLFRNSLAIIEVPESSTLSSGVPVILQVSPVEEISTSEQRDKNEVPLHNLTRCSSTELALSKESLVYTWEMKGFLGYYAFMKKFNQLFELKTEEISFKSDIVDGKWFFKLSKIVSSPGQEDLMITSTYSYEAKQPKKLNFNILLSLFHDEKEIVLPTQRSTNPVVMQQRLYNRRGYSSYYEYVHTFTWTNVGQAIENIIQKKLSPATDVADDGDPETVEGLLGRDSINDDNANVWNGNNEDVLLRFLVTAYFPSDPKYSGSENCQSVPLTALPGLIRDARITARKIVHPPYLKHSNSMLHDERFTDVLLKVGEQEFQAHRIILATSSPVFSTLLHNETTETQENEVNSNGTEEYLVAEPHSLQLGDDIPGNIIMEMLRYIYTGRVNSLDRIADKMIQAADKFDLPELKRMCEKILFPKVIPDNAIEMYNLGHQVSSTILMRRAFAVMKKNKAKLVTQSEEFRRLASQHPNLMFELFVST